MNIRPARIKIAFVALMLAASAISGCGDDEEESASSQQWPQGDISMTTPYVSIDDMGSARDIYSTTEDSPLGRVHIGIDFFPNGDLKPYQAVSSGVITRIEHFQDNNSKMWMVNVTLKYNETYSVAYGFEPYTTSQEVGDAQRANISVSVNQSVSQGDIIGKLVVAHSSAHVHFSLMKDGADACPEPYFTAEARESVLALIHSEYPDWNMCY